MKFRHIASAICAIGAILLLFSCKTTEENYRAAYQRTIEGRADSDDSLYSAVKQRVPDRQITLDGSSFPVKGAWVSLTEGGGGIRENIRRYCVVAGGFKQQFNAKAMRERLCDNGYPAAFVVQDSEPFFYVVAGSFSDAKPAMELANQLRDAPPFPLRDGMPMILLPSQIK